METKLTKQIKKSLINKYCSDTFHQYYGALEVPTDNYSGKGKHNVDFAMYNPSNQEISCFEVKISLTDFNSDAELSFVGNKNYLVMPMGLAKYVNNELNEHDYNITDEWVHMKDIRRYHIGIIGYDEKIEKLKTLKYCKTQNVHLTQKINVIEGILRAGCRDAVKYYLN